LLSLDEDIESGAAEGAQEEEQDPDAPTLMVGYTQYDIALNNRYRCVDAAELVKTVPGHRRALEEEIISIDLPIGFFTPSVVKSVVKNITKSASTPAAYQVSAIETCDLDHNFVSNVKGQGGDYREGEQDI
jgi:hypothetical protein